MSYYAKKDKSPYSVRKLTARGIQYAEPLCL
jgi:hypothetical protein